MKRFLKVDNTEQMIQYREILRQAGAKIYSGLENATGMEGYTGLHVDENYEVCRGFSNRPDVVSTTLGEAVDHVYQYRIRLDAIKQAEAELAAAIKASLDAQSVENDVRQKLKTLKNQ